MLQENNQRILEESKFDHLESPTKSCIFPHKLQEQMRTPADAEENASLSGGTATVDEMTSEQEYSS